MVYVDGCHGSYKAILMLLNCYIFRIYNLIPKGW